MPGCSAFGCKNRSEKGFKMNIFPRDPGRRAEWTVNVRRENWTPTNNSFLCHTHFDEHQWETARQDGKKKLKWSAVPTIFTFTPEPKPRRKLPSKRKQELLPSPIKALASDHSYTSTRLQPIADGYSSRISDEEGNERTDSPAYDIIDITNDDLNIDTLPAHSDTLPAHSDTLPAHSDTLPAHSDTLPAHSDTLPAHSDTLPAHSDTLPAHSDTLPAHSDTLPAHSDTLPAHSDTLPAHSDTLPAHSDTLPAHSDTLPAYNYTIPHIRPHITLHHSLEEKVRYLEDQLVKQAHIIRGLRKKVRASVIEKSRERLKDLKTARCFHNFLRREEVKTVKSLSTFLNDNQISALGVKSTKGKKWSKQTIEKAVKLKLACGSTGYEELLRQKYPLPSLRTLRRKFKSQIL